jgi:hypothetical protein
MPWHVDLAELIQLGDQRKQVALLQAAQASRHGEEKLDEVRRLREDIANPVPRLMPEFQLDRPRLFARLRTVAVMQAHRAEVELHARALENDAEALREQEAQRRAEAARYHARREKFAAYLSRMALERRRSRATREENSIQEAYTCRF